MKTINHKRDGLFTEWWENGKKRWEGTFKNGELNGLYMEWYMDGRKMIEVTYKNGKEDGPIFFSLFIGYFYHFTTIHVPFHI